MRLLIFIFVTFDLIMLSVCDSLSIKPEHDTISRPAGSSVVITCSSVVASRIKWLDTSGSEIDNGYWDTRFSLDELSSLSKKLILTNIQNSDSGYYTCVGNVSGSLQEKSIKLIIFNGITFDDVSLSQHVLINTTSTIICKVSGETQPVIYWKFNRKKIVPGTKFIIVPEGLKVVNVTEKDAGLYTCIAEIDNAGLLESKTINVTVYVPPRIIKGVGTSKAIQGDNFNFTCLADGYPVPAFEFYKVAEDGIILTMISENNRVVLKANKLMFKPTFEEDEGYYKCVAKNEAGAVESAIGHFMVLVPAKVIQFHDITVNEGSIASIMCTVNGKPFPDVLLGKKQDVRALNMSYGRMKTRILQENIYQLEIFNVIAEDSGIYFCEARNSLAEDFSIAKINIQYRPRINLLTTLPLVHTWAGVYRNITTYFYSSPMPNITWYLRSTKLKPNDTFRIFSGHNFSSLQVFARKIDQTWIYGEYKCFLENFLGHSDIHIELKRATIPSSPEVIFMVSYATEIWLTLNPPKEDGGMPITGYIVQNQDTIHEFGLDREVKIKHLKPNTNYLLFVKAKNVVGAGIPHRVELYTKGISEPSLFIVKSQQQQSKPFEQQIFWKVNSSGGMPILEYEALHKKLEVPSARAAADPSFIYTLYPHSGLEVYGDGTHDFVPWSTKKVKDNLRRPMSDLVIKDLEPRSVYVLKLRARNAIGWSAFTIPIIFITGEALQSKLEIGEPGNMSGLIPIIIFLPVPLVLVVVFDVMCCYRHNKGLTKAIVSKCSKLKSSSNTGKPNLSLSGGRIYNKNAPSVDRAGKNRERKKLRSTAYQPSSLKGCGSQVK